MTWPLKHDWEGWAWPYSLGQMSDTLPAGMQNANLLSCRDISFTQNWKEAHLFETGCKNLQKPFMKSDQLIQRWHRYYPKFPELYSRSINSLIYMYNNCTKIPDWTLTYGINCHFGFNMGILIHFPCFQTFSPFLINYLYLETLFIFPKVLSFYLKFSEKWHLWVQTKINWIHLLWRNETLHQRWHRYYPKFPELYSRRMNSLIITAYTWLNTYVWNTLPFWSLIREFDTNSFSPNLSPLFDQLFLSRDTVSFFLKFFISIWNFLISGNFLKSGISATCTLIILLYWSIMNLKRHISDNKVHQMWRFVVILCSFTHWIWLRTSKKVASYEMPRDTLYNVDVQYSVLGRDYVHCTMYM